MPILKLQTDITGQVGVVPRRVTLESNDSLNTILTPGYLNGANLMGNLIYPTDEVHITYDVNKLIVCTVSISNTTITLTPFDSGGIVLPTVAGHLAKFNDTKGTLEDSGKVANDVVIKSGSLTNGNLPRFSGTSGTVVDSGLVASDVVFKANSITNGDLPVFDGTSGRVIDSGISVINVVTKIGTLISGNIAQFEGTAGVINDSGIAASAVPVIVSQTTGNLVKFGAAGELADVGAFCGAVKYVNGGGTTISITDPNITGNTVVTANFQSQANPANMLKVTPTTGTLTITCNADPGNNTLNYIYFSITI